MTIKDLKPKEIWQFFYELTRIPRPSKKEEKVIAYLMQFAKERSLQSKQDEAGNVLITKQATPGYENLPTVVLQGHIDMVCEKNNDVVHDFDTDPIETWVDGDWLKARGTTLGADNGIGVAAALALLDSKTLEHGKIECLFTVDEETGLTGAYALKPGFLTGNILLNLDTEEEGEIYIGCAGGKNTVATFEYTPQTPPADYYWFRFSVTGLLGGHSGSEIHLGRGNANKIAARYLRALSLQAPLSIASFDGGNLHNAIPREATVVAGVPSGQKELCSSVLNILAAEIGLELQKPDPDAKLKVETAEAPKTVIDSATAQALVTALIACPHGVLGRSHYIEGLVETSTNLASVKMREGNTIEVVTSQRSSVESQKNFLADVVNSVFTLAGAIVCHGDGYPGWKPNPDSPVLKVAERVYQRMFGKMPEVKAIHAGLECGLFSEKYPTMDMISFGPTMCDVHSPDEKIFIPSVEKWWKYMLELLKNLPK
jgi:dipeptidase D